MIIPIAPMLSSHFLGHYYLTDWSLNNDLAKYSISCHYSDKMLAR